MRSAEREFRVAFVRRPDGMPMVGKPMSEDEALATALGLQRGFFVNLSVDEVQEIRIEERLVIDERPLAWRSYSG